MDWLEIHDLVDPKFEAGPEFAEAPERAGVEEAEEGESPGVSLKYLLFGGGAILMVALLFVLAGKREK